MNCIVIVFTALISMITPFRISQYSVSGNDRINLTHSGEKIWNTEYQDAKLKIESSVIIQKDQSINMNQERIVFRYTNLSGKKVKLNFGRKLYYNGICYGCDKTDKLFTIELEAAQSKEFSSENKDKTFYIFSKDLNGTIKKTLDKFELTNIEIIVQ